MYGFLNERAAVAKMYPDLSEAELDKKAAENVRNLYPNYDMVPKIVKAVRRFPLMGTFISFTYEALRTTIQTQVIAQNEIRHGIKTGNARAVANGAKRLAGTAASFALPSLLANLLHDDEDEKEIEALRSVVPHWSKNSVLLKVGEDENGDPQIIDLSYTDPHSLISNAFRAVTHAMKRIEEGDSIAYTTEAAVGEAMESLFGTFLSEEIMVEAMFDILRNSDRNGRPVFVPEEPLSERMRDTSNHLRKAFQPGLLSSGERV